MYTRKKQSGFTLIELLMTIAIIAILATIVIQHVSGARKAAQDAKTVASVRSAMSVATECMDKGDNLSTPNITSPICVGRSTWPAPVGDGWLYGNFGTCSFDGDVSDFTFKYCVSDGATVIACSENGCNSS